MRTKDLVNLEEAVNKVYLKEEESYESSNKTITLTPQEAERLLDLINDPDGYTSKPWVMQEELRKVLEQLYNSLGRKSPEPDNWD